MADLPIFIDDHIILCPISYYRQAKLPVIKIDQDTQDELKLRLEEFSRYFKKEMSYDLIDRYKVGHEQRPDKRFFLFSIRADDLNEENVYATANRLIGGCGFDKVDRHWVLDWVWLHPFFRHRNLFLQYWLGLEEEVGEFKISTPVSCQMRNFLQRHRPSLLLKSED